MVGVVDVGVTLNHRQYWSQDRQGCSDSGLLYEERKRKRKCLCIYLVHCYVYSSALFIEVTRRRSSRPTNKKKQVVDTASRSPHPSLADQDTECAFFNVVGDKPCQSRYKTRLWFSVLRRMTEKGQRGGILGPGMFPPFVDWYRRTYTAVVAPL